MDIKISILENDALVLVKFTKQHIDNHHGDSKHYANEKYFFCLNEAFGRKNVMVVIT